MKKLANWDLVILNSNSNPLRFHNGDIVIYNDPEEALEDCIKGDKVVKALDLEDKLIKELEVQINK